ncbi:MAG: DUF1289 domain-containing protein [Sphingomonas sp.]|nr:DUF1289 domain-containing protein [Sphingomonas sp.]
MVPPIESPCVNICRVERGSCVGCGRTVAEIARWGSTTDEDRSAVMAELPARMARLRKAG